MSETETKSPPYVDFEDVLIDDLDNPGIPEYQPKEFSDPLYGAFFVWGWDPALALYSDERLCIEDENGMGYLTVCDDWQDLCDYLIELGSSGNFDGVGVMINNFWVTLPDRLASYYTYINPERNNYVQEV